MNEATEKIIDDCPLRRSLYFAFEQILEETLGGIKQQDVVLYLDEQTVWDLERTEEIQIYWKSGQYLCDIGRPRESYYGFRVQLIRHLEMVVDGTKRQTKWKRVARLAGRMDNGYPMEFSVDVAIPGITDQ